MKFILKEGLVHIVENNGVYNNNIEAEIEAPELQGFSIDYKVNNGEYKKVEHNTIVIPKELLKATNIKLVFRAIKEKEIKYFESDVLPLTQAIIFGGTIDQYYPKVIKELLHKVDSIFSNLVNIKEFADDQARITREELRGTMIELVDTFEEITKKGSLF